jgi:hypothetical protein
MKRDLSPEESRDELIGTLTDKHFVQRLGSLIRGNQDTVRSVDNDLSHKLCDDEVMGRLIMLAVTDARQAGAMLNDLIEQVVRDAAECDAIREVEQMERERVVQVAEARAEQSMFVRMAIGERA